MIITLLCGGLVATAIAYFKKRQARWQELRRKFYPKGENLFAAYNIRMEQPEGRFWVGVAASVPAEEDREFINHRSSFLKDIIPFTELREVRRLRNAFIENMLKGDSGEGQQFTIDLKPEYDALAACMNTLRRKLKI